MREFTITQRDERKSVIRCGEGVFKSALPVSGRTFVFTDSNVYALYKAEIEACFQGAPVYVMEAGEEHKTERTLFALLGAMAKAQLHRSDCLICLGGGVVGDIGGLASALYMRGTACVQIPTTLLAQVDSSVGGKTAVDFSGIKNLVGAFKQPDLVLVDGAFLKTLPEREIRCGLGEIIKHAALDKDLFSKLTENGDRLFDLAFLAEIVPENIAIKARVVQEDPTEKGLRKCLNLGHTTAHAFELSHKKLSHGEYVLAGIIYEAEIAKERLSCDGAYLKELEGLALRALGGMPAFPPAEEVAPLALLDKKNTESQRIVLTVPVKQGEYALLELSFEEYARALKRIGDSLC